jgi:hypothetical protein
MEERREHDQKQKQDSLNRLLEGEYALIHINTAAKGVEVPAHLMTTPTLTLKLSRWFRGALAVEEDKVVAELLFNSRYFTCTVPFDSIWGVTGDKGENLVWPSALPEDVAKKLSPQPQASPLPATESTGSGVETPIRQRPHLRRIK